MKYLVDFALLLFAASFIPAPLLAATDFQGCENCHRATLFGDNSRIYLHPPYSKQQCGECHALKTSGSSQAPTSVKKLATSSQSLGKINWLGDSVMADTNHGFLLPSSEIGETMVVDVQGADGRLSRRKMAVPLLADLGDVEDSGQPPVVSEVRVLKVVRGVFLSATVGWQTDTLADSLVYYGIGNLSQASEPNKRLGKRHEVVLYNLKPDQVYRFSVVSTDPFGRSQTSEPSEFSTTNPYQAPLPGTSETLAESADEVGMTGSFQRIGTNYLFQLTFDQPAAVYIGSGGAARKQALPLQVPAPPPLLPCRQG